MFYFLTLLYSIYRGIRCLKSLWITHIITSTIGGLLLTCGQPGAEESSEDNTGQTDQGNREKTTPYITWNNSPLDKNPMADFGK